MLRRNLVSLAPKHVACVGLLTTVTNGLRRRSLCATGLSGSFRYHSTSSNMTPTNGGNIPHTLPHQCSIEQVLIPELEPGGSGIRTDTLRGVVQLLIDSGASDVEDVSMLDFVAMVPRRQLTALRGRREWLDVVLASERYQVCKDARALRLAGITTVGRWDENRERVPVSMYTRGVLEEAYATMARQPAESQKDQVIMWLTKTIQAAVIEEFVANKGNRKILAPLITGMQAALPGAVAAAASEAAGEKRENKSQEASAASATEEGEDKTDASGNKFNKSPKNRGKRHARQVELAAGEGFGEGEEDKVAAAASNSKKNEKAAETVHTDEDAEIARLLEETEQEFAPAPYVRGNRNLNPVATPENVKAEASDPKAMRVRHKKRGTDDSPQKKGRHHNADVEEEQRGENAATASATTVSPPNKRERESLARLTALMLHQFSSADGYLHLPDVREDEKRGFVIPIDDEISQVDPFALYSAFSSTSLSRNDTAEIAALKQVWAAYNSYAEAREASTADVASVRFYKEKGVEALIHAAVLLRTISRGHPVTVDVRDVPPFGFPLLSSDRRPYRSRRGKNVTDMTAEKVDEAVKAFTAFFANKKCRFTPIRPAIDFNSGCSVVALMGTTLHLYETSLKSSVREEDIRCRFAEAMLGVLHVLDQQILTRVNVVHYHILATSISGGSGTNRATAMSNANTSIVSIDTEGPFSVAEKKRLYQLAEPLGLANAIAQCESVSSLVEAIEEFDVSVVHDILTNRDDLEALLTPTLVQLLPEADDDDDFDEMEEIAAPARRGIASRDSSTKHGSSQIPQTVGNTLQGTEMEGEETKVVVKSGRGGKSRSPPSRSTAMKEEEVEEEEEEEEEEVEMADGEAVDEEEVKYEEVEEEQVNEQAEFHEAKKRPQQPLFASANGKRGGPPPTRGREQRDRLQAMERGGDGVEGAPRRPSSQPDRKFVPDSFRSVPSSEIPPAPVPRRGYITRRPAPPVMNHEVDEIEEEEEEAVRRPIRRTPPTRRPPSPSFQSSPQPSPSRLQGDAAVREVSYDDEEAEAELTTRPRVRSTSGVRRVGRVAISNSSDIIGDEDRWFERVRR
ncbi:uncharacterized protein TEOVI_000808500 [Trypanosoma equiperdum]|uniref:Uncharacterized protein n=1 Tax=Trypanosoma equiperdum TaxID=5694 RepID=A0A1G4I7P4_TRYEQ|nr:hypothetical protein, conserved [Trypanosoma equiperdum]